MSAGVEVTSLADLAGDLAGTYPRSISSGATVDPAVADADLQAVLRDGYVILPALLTSDEIESIRAATAPLLNRHGRNNFEGHATQRVYSVLNKTRACDRIADHPRVLAILDRLLLPNYLLSMLQVIVEEQVYLYYGGYKQGHKMNRFEERQIGLVAVSVVVSASWLVLLLVEVEVERVVAVASVFVSWLVLLEAEVVLDHCQLAVAVVSASWIGQIAEHPLHH